MKNKKAKKLLKEAKKLIKKIKKQGKDGEIILTEIRKLLGSTKAVIKTKKTVKKNQSKTRAPKTPTVPKEEISVDAPSDAPGTEPQV